MADARQQYSGKVILAPMVRCGTLPLRLLALEYGADLVYSEEIVDFKAPFLSRVENEDAGTVDFVSSKGGRAVYRTCKAEEAHNIVQLGTSSDVRAVAAARIFERDVAGIDVNMGCPKRFSLQAGMGAGLLSKVETATAIIKALRRNLNVPVTCKIRLLETTAKTVDYMRAMEAAGAQAIGVHARHIEDRPRHPAHYDLLREVAPCVKIPVIANGDIYTPADIDATLAIPGVSSCMLARGALRNVSVFERRPTMRPLEEVIQEYVRRTVDVNSFWSTTKYTIQQFYRYNDLLPSERGVSMSKTKSVDACLRLYSLTDYVRQPSHVVTKRCTTAAGSVTTSATDGDAGAGPDSGCGAGAGAGAGAGVGAGAGASAGAGAGGGESGAGAGETPVSSVQGAPETRAGKRPREDDDAHTRSVMPRTS